LYCSFKKKNLRFNVVNYKLLLMAPKLSAAADSRPVLTGEI
jgi:hypothetical protein